MEEADDRRRRQVGSWLMFGAFGLATAANVGLANLIVLDSSLMISGFAGSLVGLIAVARVLTPALSPPVATLLGGALGAGLAFGLGWPLGLGAFLGAQLGALGFVGATSIIDTGSGLHDAASSAAKEWRDPYT